MNREEVIGAMAVAIDTCSGQIYSLCEYGLNADNQFALTNAAGAALQAITGTGYAVVPVEPTEAMLDAQFMAYNSIDNISLSDWDKAKAIYKAMLDAAK
ncbi:MAG: hypothetical protein AAF650_05905 [Pseudomonadota bacterium]